MAKRNNKNIKVVGVRRESPDLEKLAKAIVALALQQLERDRTRARSPSEVDQSPGTKPGAAA